MNSRRLAIALSPFVLAIAACSSSTTSQAGPSCEPEGTYEVTPTRVGGSCPDAATHSDPYTVTVTTDGENITAGLQYAGINCPGTIKGCKATIACTSTLKSGGTGSIQVSWTFDAKGLHGTTSDGFQPAGADNCTADYDEVGTKK